MKKIPNIRFKGFEGEWEDVIIGDTLLERIEQKPKSDDFPLMAFIANVGIANKGEKYDRSALINDVEGKLYKRTQKDDFIYSSNNLQSGSIGLNTFGNASISPVYSIFRCTEKAIPKFIGTRYICADIIKEMIKWRQGVVYGQWKIHESDFLRIPVNIPFKPEQQQIASFFDSLDTLISKREKEVEKMRNIKKALLEKMFPQQGESVPQIHFAEFKEEWKEKEFGSIITESKEVSTIENEDTLLSSAIDGMFLNSELFNHQRGASNKGYRRIRKGMLILSAQNLHLGNANVNLRFDHGLVSPAYKIYNMHDCIEEFIIIGKTKCTTFLNQMYKIL